MVDSEEEKKYLAGVGSDIRQGRVDTTPKTQDEDNSPALSLSEDETGEESTGGDTQVPAYQYKTESPGYKPEPAYQAPAKPPAETVPETEEPEPETETGQPRRGIGEAFDQAKQRFQEVKEQAKEWAKEQLKKLAWDAIKTGVKAFFANPEIWVPVVAVILIIGIIIGAIFFIVKARQTPNGWGTSPAEAANILGDRPWISRILALANDPNAAAQLETSLGELETGLSGLEADMQKPPLSNLDAGTKQKITSKIAEIRQLISDFRQTAPNDSAKRSTTAQKIVTAVSQLVDLFAPAPFHYSGTTKWPISKESIGGYGNSLHCGTPMRPGECPIGKYGKPKSHHTFLQYMKGTADAVDISVAAGATVFAVFDGEITQTGNVHRGDSSLGQYAELKGSDGYLAVYLHIKVTKTGSVKAGDPIGSIYPLSSGAHLHFELYRNNQAVVTTREDMADYNSSHKKYQQVGQYLWERDKSVLNLQ